MIFSFLSNRSVDKLSKTSLPTRDTSAGELSGASDITATPTADTTLHNQAEEEEEEENEDTSASQRSSVGNESNSLPPDLSVCRTLYSTVLAVSRSLITRETD